MKGSVIFCFTPKYHTRASKLSLSDYLYSIDKTYMHLACSDVLLPNKRGKNSIKISEIIASTENNSEIKMMIIRLAVVITGPQYGGPWQRPNLDNACDNWKLFIKNINLYIMISDKKLLKVK